MYKAIILALLFFSMNLSAQNIPDRKTLFSSKKEFQERVGWILNGKSSRFKKESRSSALDTQADSIYFSYSFDDEEYSEPTRYYITYGEVGGEKLPTEFVFAEGYEEDFSFRFVMNYNDQNQVIGGDIYFAVFTTNEKIGYYEQRFDSKGILIYHYAKAEIGDSYEEIYGDSLAIVYNNQNQEINVESYTIDIESGDWVITSIISNMQYDSEGELIAYDRDVFEGRDTINVIRHRLQNLLWYGGYNFQFFSDVFASETVLNDVSPEPYIPTVLQGHLFGPIQVESYNYLNGEWEYAGKTIVDSLTQNYISVLSLFGSTNIRLQITLNEDNLILTAKSFIEGVEPVFLFSYEYGYNEFGLPVFEKQLNPEDGIIYEIFTAEYEVDDDNRLLLFEYESGGNFREKGEYFYAGGVSTSSFVLQNDAVKVFPNPVENKMTIQSELDIIKPMQYQIISPDGRTLMSGVFEENVQHEISVSNLPSGIYFFKWQMAEKYGCQKVLKL